MGSVFLNHLLELKVIAVSLQKQMTMNWVKMMRIIKELVSKKISSTSLLSFVEFMMASNLPISLLIMPALAKVYLSQSFNTLYVASTFYFLDDS